MTARKRVAILISGRGSNMSALIEAAKAADYPAEIVGVLSNKPDAPGLGVARAEGIPTAVVSMKAYGGKAGADAQIDRVLTDWGVDIVCLAGFMRLLSAKLTEKWRGRMINVHPSLLPAFKGLDTHARAIAESATEHGCTVHFVTPEMDEGPVIVQARVPVLPGDTPDTLAARVLEQEHRIYPEALRKLASGQVSIST